MRENYKPLSIKGKVFWSAIWVLDVALLGGPLAYHYFSASDGKESYFADSVVESVNHSEEGTDRLVKKVESEK